MCSPEVCRRLQTAEEPWNELERGLERGNELERGSGTRIKLERAGTRIWNEAPAGTRIAGTSLSRILDKLERERELGSATCIASYPGSSPVPGNEN
eukprot:gene10263-biopygen2226